jgi:hypothetical protein
MRCNPRKAIVIILGTFHGGEDDAPQYISRLRMIIEEIMPDVICAELSPEQLDGATTCDSKPEYPEAILPLARRHKIEVIPMQPTTYEGIKTEKRKLAVIEEIEADEQSKLRWEFSEYLTEVTAAKWLEVLKDPAGIENVQLREFDLLQVEPGWIANKLFFPELAEQWDMWNAYFLDRISATIREHPGKRILITAGLAHKYWLWNRLSLRDDLILHDLRSWRDAGKK